MFRLIHIKQRHDRPGTSIVLTMLCQPKTTYSRISLRIKLIHEAVVIETRQQVPNNPQLNAIPHIYHLFICIFILDFLVFPVTSAITRAYRWSFNIFSGAGGRGGYFFI